MGNIDGIVTVRSLVLNDIDFIVNYWFSHSEDFWVSRGVDIKKIGTPESYKESLLKKFKIHSEIPSIIIIECNGKPVGHHAISHILPNESAVFHAHIWLDESRKKGTCSISYIKACRHFMNAFNLKKIFFKTPKINVGANKLKEKIGLKKIGDTIFDSPILLRPLESNLYELKSEEI